MLVEGCEMESPPSDRLVYSPVAFARGSTLTFENVLVPTPEERDEPGPE